MIKNFRIERHATKHAFAYVEIDIDIAPLVSGVEGRHLGTEEKKEYAINIKRNKKILVLFIFYSYALNHRLFVLHIVSFILFGFPAPL